MVLIDKSNEPRPTAKKTDRVKTRREVRDGKVVNVKVVDMGGDFDALSADLRYVFTSNVRAVTRRKRQG